MKTYDNTTRSFGRVRFATHYGWQKFYHVIWPFSVMKYLLWVVPGLVFSCAVLGKKVIKVKTSSKLLTFLLVFLKYNSCFNMEELLEVATTDLSPFNTKHRFAVNYLLLNVEQNFRISVQVKVVENAPLPTSADIYSSIYWLERETWDMFGIYFTGSVDLRRLLTDYSFTWFPLRKNFPVVGYYELFFDDYSNYIVHEPVQFMHEPRLFFVMQ